MPVPPGEPIDLYEVIRARDETGSMIITSNRAIEEWHGPRRSRGWQTAVHENALGYP